MCLQVVEKYAICGCVYYKHAVDPCSSYGVRYHSPKIRSVSVGTNTCPRHSRKTSALALGDDSDERSTITLHGDSYGERAGTSDRLATQSGEKFTSSHYPERVRVQPTTPNTGTLDNSSSEIVTKRSMAAGFVERYN